MSPAVGLVAAAWCVVVGVGLIFGDSPCGRKGGRPGKGRGGTARPENERPLLDALSTLWSVTKGIVFTLVSLAALPVTVGLPVALSCGCALLPPDFTLRLPCSARRYRPRRWVDRLRLFAYIEFCAPRFPAPSPSAAACDPLPLQPPAVLTAVGASVHAQTATSSRRCTPCRGSTSPGAPPSAARSPCCSAARCPCEESSTAPPSGRPFATAGSCAA